jgi:hypothetical protein
MKTMTCKDMGGPCDESMTAASAEEMIAMGGAHVHATLDDAHKAIAADMAAMTPESSQAWNDEFSKKWDAAADAETA